MCPTYEFYPQSLDYVPTSKSAQKVNWSLEYFSQQQDLFNNDTAIEEGGIPLDYQLLIEDNFLQNVWPQITDDIYNFPLHTLAVLSLAMHEVFSILLSDIYICVYLKTNFQILLQNTIKRDKNFETERDFSQSSKLPINVPYVRARLFNYQKITSLKKIRAALFGKLVAVRGTVVRASNVKPVCLALTFKCRTCYGVMTYPETDGKYELPPRCILFRNESQCIGNNFEPLRGSSRNVFVQWQSIIIQENSSENFVIISILH